MSQATILCVDDEPHVLHALKRLLRKQHYTVLTAPGGAEGLEILARENVQVIISDQRMPDMTGTEFLAEAKVRHPDAVRVILSGYAEAHTIVDAINKGNVYRFLPKPWDDDHLKAEIGQCLDRYQLLRENQRLTDLLDENVREVERLKNLLDLLTCERNRALRDIREWIAAHLRDDVGCADVGVLREWMLENGMPATAGD